MRIFTLYGLTYIDFNKTYKKQLKICACIISLLHKLLYLINNNNILMRETFYNF